MTNDKLEKVMDKVRKLIALSKSSNEHEAARALERAQALLAEYNLSIKDVEQSGGANYMIVRGPLGDPLPYRRTLGAGTARMYFCSYFYTVVPQMSRSGNLYDRERPCFAGAPHNLPVVQAMYDYLVKTVDRLSAEGAAKLKGTSKYWSYQTAFKVACAQRLYARIEERIAAASAGELKTEAGTNLPALASMYDTAAAEVQKWIESQVGELDNTASRSQRYDVLGLLDGATAGDNIGLDTQVTGGARQAAIGRA